MFASIKRQVQCLHLMGAFNYYVRTEVRGGSTKMQTYAKRDRGGVTSMRTLAYIYFLIKYLIHKLLTIVTRFCVSFIKIPVLLKICFKKLYLALVLKIIYQLGLLQTINLK